MPISAVSLSDFFAEKSFGELIGARQVVQINQSCTRNPGAVRGMHYQCVPHAEMKLVRCLKGCVWDVAVDLRADSESFLTMACRRTLL